MGAAKNEGWKIGDLRWLWRGGDIGGGGVQMYVKEGDREGNVRV